MSALIEVSDLVKVYPDGTRAVDDVTFEVERGETFGFLGPNGAGKTTTIRVLVTLLPKTSGRATVGGIDLDRDPEGIRSMIGYAGQFIGVDVDLTGEGQADLSLLPAQFGKVKSDKSAEARLDVGQKEIHPVEP